MTLALPPWRAVVLAAFATGAPGAAGRAGTRHRHARRAGAAARLRPSALCQSGGAQGRPTDAGVLGTFDSLNPFIVKGLALSQIRGYVVESLLARGYDEPFTLYGLLARTVETDAERTYVTFALDPAAKFSDGKAGDRRGRDLFLAAPARQGPAELPHLLRQGRQGRGAVGARRALRSDRRQRPRAAADPRPDAGAAEARRQSRHLRGHHVRADRRQRPLCGRQGRRRPQHHAQARSELLGPRPRHQSRPVEFRRGPLRLLPRRQFASRGVQEGPLRRAHGDRSRPLGDRLRRPRGARRPHRQGGISQRAAEDQFSGLVFNTRRPIFSDIRVREAIGCCSTSNGSTTTFFYRSLPALGELLRRLRAVGAGPPGGAARARAARAVSRRGARRRHGRHLAARRHPTAPAATANTLKRALALLDQPATSSTARCCARARRGSRSASRSWSPPGTRSGWRSPSRATSSAPASRRACAWSMPCNTTGGDSPSIST